MEKHEIVNNKEFDKVKEDYCPQCYFNDDKMILRKDCPHNTKELQDLTEEDLQSPVFEAIWQAIKKWDIERDYGVGRAGASGTDVKTILNAIEPFLSTPLNENK